MMVPRRPHRDHVLLNLAQPGTLFLFYTAHACLEARLPSEVRQKCTINNMK